MTASPASNHSWSTIEAVASDVRVCTACRLCESRTHAVPGEGSPTASILFIGEGPGATEDKQGRPFVGRAGKLLDELLAAVPLKREDVFITNVVKCRPPENRDPQPDEVEACRPYLEAQIELINPRVIVTLGRHSLLRFFPDGRISKDHGRMFRWNDRILYPLYHPAAGLRSSTVMQAIREDVKRLPEAVIESLRITGSSRDDQDSGAASPPPEPEQPDHETGGDDQQQLNLF